jgi:hypothetical protein
VIPLRQPDRHADGLRVDDRGSAFTPGLGAALRDEDTLLAAPPGGEAWSTWRGGRPVGRRVAPDDAVDRRSGSRSQRHLRRRLLG